MASEQTPPSELPSGQNAWLIEEMFARYQADPDSVSAGWRNFFADYRSHIPEAAPPEQQAPPATPAGPAAVPARSDLAPVVELAPEGRPLRGPSARLAANMEASLAVPTATSYREIPAKLLDVNRLVINGHLRRTRGGKVSYTHLIAYAVVRAVADHAPEMNTSFVSGADGVPRTSSHPHVGLGIAVDHERSDGTRTLLVPCLRHAEELGFRDFAEAYDELVMRTRNNRLTADDFAGTTVTLTNPGMLGTRWSAPRLMAGQGLIVGVGAIDYPAAFQGADPHTLAGWGISKVVVLSSTYDHRIIQGAQSGDFLTAVHDLLVGGHGFYRDIFRDLGVPYKDVQWRRDVMGSEAATAMAAKQSQVDALIAAHRDRGHLIADLDPLALNEPDLHQDLDPAGHGLTIWDLDREFAVSESNGLEAAAAGRDRLPLREILGLMRDAYCRTLGVDYTHILDPAEKRWIREQVESPQPALSGDEKLRILDRLNAAEALETFLGTRYVGQKRFGLEGAESVICAIDAILIEAADARMHSAIIGMAHRGRLNVLVNIVGKTYGQLFREFEGAIDPDAVQGSGDVKYHLGMSGKFTSPAGNPLQVDLAANPSHLEAVGPVVVGMAKARMDALAVEAAADAEASAEGSGAGGRPGAGVLPLVLHGDAAFAGQGVVTETLHMSQLDGYSVGGTIHLVINNQVGFTATASEGRSSPYPTDVARMIQAPIFHVNGDDPEACVRAGRLAFHYRRRWGKDVVIDLWCYRRRGHNEGDDPSITQPKMYNRIAEHRPVRKGYVERLILQDEIDMAAATEALDNFESMLAEALDDTRAQLPEGQSMALPPKPPTGALPDIDTTVPLEGIRDIYAALSRLPDGFSVHPRVAKHLGARDRMFADSEADWALAETLAFGSLLRQGTSVRLSGQDSRRGTFSQRHSTFVDNVTGAEHTPLAALCAPRTRLWTYDSLLSEYAALGFEYGYSLGAPEVLTLWEAQFGDFANGAQIIIDQFLVAAVDKWRQGSGLVLLLPHGFEGQGPEHSSARIERFLSLSAEDNMTLAQPTTAAQYFHLLRRQALWDLGRPLVVFSPKSLLRARPARSPLEEFAGGSFRAVLDDPAPPRGADRVVLCSGKVGHEAVAKRDSLAATAAVMRVEQLYPWPAAEIAAALARYPDAGEVVWLQDEPRNMGAWNFARDRLTDALDGARLVCVSRPESASPATGSRQIHLQEQTQLLNAAFASLDTIQMLLT
ncbi:MAG: multifunctional oxoglutarate decarboxylase/oxoglutarate dehydrogenase thiamine pyrophosphate-binding subunit/dihydrolipoyllysine-residue succinyltransferase subunit [bacterium]|nr:multifunctional oxoglutarate decarboxylase/oxoglutarate dehydrogenase thiamine pyrophosphate-binding subunit/dihydrolipoyllysine-residue succinyltransferase subunit [bacterium]